MTFLAARPAPLESPGVSASPSPTSNSAGRSPAVGSHRGPGCVSGSPSQNASDPKVLRGGSSSASTPKPRQCEVDPSLLEVQLVQIEWPGKEMRPIAAWLDLDDSCLALREVSLAPLTKKVEFGAETLVNFSQISDASIVAGALQVSGPRGIALLKMHLDSTEDLQLWTYGLRSVLTGTSRATTPAATGSEDSTIARLKAKIADQEKQVRVLEQQKESKDQYLVQLHGRLEEALGVLQNGQKMYAEQNKVMEIQKDSIEQLTQALGESMPSDARSSEERAPATMPAASPTQSRAAAAFAVAAQAARSAAVHETASPSSQVLDEEQNDEIIELERRTRELQLAAEEAARLAAEGGSLEANPELLAKLCMLLQQKDDLADRLQREQADLEKQLGELKQ